MSLAQIRHPAGFIIKFSTKSMPVTSGLRNTILGIAPKQAEETSEALLVKKPFQLMIARGEPSSHGSSKCRFETPISYEDMKGRATRRQCKYNDGRKPKTFSRATIRTMYLN